MNSFTFSERRLEDDYYCVLGCNDSSSAEQILIEYKHRILLCHPDKSQDDTSTAQFQKLQEAKKVLCDPDKRKDYDRWKASGIAVTYKQWVTMQKGFGTPVFHWATPKTDGKMLEFNSGWLPTNPRSNEIFQPSGTAYSNNSILKKFRNYEI
ncbi:J domain-containing protein-like [Daphnia pulicaria]|uniref:J domain-containing protein-like n=1 Tax=Daphnia pulicaria TaxID=35523 RepID=UPI001EEA4A79|nr:J domain-containing protein-like [Daphnia pulicaria]